MKISKSQALTPDEVKSLKKTDPGLIIETINLLLVRKYKKGWINIYDYEILDLAKKSPDFISVEKNMSEDVVSELMKIYSDKGWKVRRTYPFPEEGPNKYFRFKPKKSWFHKIGNLFDYLFDYDINKLYD